MVYHVLNRSVGKMKMFKHPKDFQAFQRLLIEAHDRLPIRLLSYCIMGTHWYLRAGAWAGGVAGDSQPLGRWTVRPIGSSR